MVDSSVAERHGQYRQQVLDDEYVDTGNFFRSFTRPDSNGITHAIDDVRVENIPYELKKEAEKETDQHAKVYCLLRYFQLQHFISSDCLCRLC